MPVLDGMTSLCLVTCIVPWHIIGLVVSLLCDFSTCLLLHSWHCGVLRDVYLFMPNTTLHEHPPMVCVLGSIKDGLLFHKNFPWGACVHVIKVNIGGQVGRWICCWITPLVFVWLLIFLWPCLFDRWLGSVTQIQLVCQALIIESLIHWWTLLTQDRSKLHYFMFYFWGPFGFPMRSLHNYFWNDRHVEELVRLPDCFLCYTPSPEAGPATPAPALSNGFITFGSFNNLAKVLCRIWNMEFGLLVCVRNNESRIFKCELWPCDFSLLSDHA